MINTVRAALSTQLKALGRQLDSMGAIVEPHPYIEKVMPSMRVLAYADKVPELDNAFVASSANVIGNVTIGSDSSVWYGAVVRGDVNSITIGNSVSICDRAMVHCSGLGVKNKPAMIGNGVTIKAGAIIHGCTIADGSVVGEGAQVLDGATVGTSAMVGAGAIVTEGTAIPGGQLWSGIPAVYERDLSEAEMESMTALATENVRYAALHALEDAKTWEEIDQEEFDDMQIKRRNKTYWKRKLPGEMDRAEADSLVLNHNVPGRILDHDISARLAKESRPHGSGGLA